MHAKARREDVERLNRAFGVTADYVFCNRLGQRLDDSAIRRRYHAAREAAGLRAVKLHGLRHGAGSLVARETDPVFVQRRGVVGRILVAS